MRAIRDTEASLNVTAVLTVPGPIYAIYHLAPSATPTTTFVDIEVVSQGVTTVFRHAASDPVVLPVATGPDGNPAEMFPAGAVVRAFPTGYNTLASGSAVPQHTLIVITE